jgi:uncharacterized protein YciI
MLYFVHGIDRPGKGALRDELIEAHWSFMDGYGDRIIARGPTLSADRTEATGSVHIVDLPSVEAARVFAFDEPNQRAGVYAEVRIHRYADLLGGTMWQHAADGVREGFLVVGHGGPGGAPVGVDGLLACGELHPEDGGERIGTAAIGQGAFVGGPFDRVEIHPWQMGGRR